MQPPVSALPGAVSPDGRWIWNGAQWLPAFPNAPQALPQVLGRAERRSVLAISGGVTALVAEALILVSYLLPYVTYDGSGSYAVFYGCVFAQNATTCHYAPLPWGIATAGVMIVLGSAVAILVIALKGRVTIALASGALIGLGFQEFSDWVAFVPSKDYSGAHLGAGILVGVIGGLVLMAGGLIAAVSVVKHPTQVSQPVGIDLERLGQVP